MQLSTENWLVIINYDNNVVGGGCGGDSDLKHGSGGDGGRLYCRGGSRINSKSSIRW